MYEFLRFLLGLKNTLQKRLFKKFILFCIDFRKTLAIFKEEDYSSFRIYFLSVSHLYVI